MGKARKIALAPSCVALSALSVIGIAGQLAAL
jgi:hypothetical protein